MVKNGVIFIMLTWMCVACELWGEPAPEEPVVDMPAPTAECLDPLKIVEGSEEEASQALSCWSDTVISSLNQIQGVDASEISDAEIATLLRHKILELPGNVEDNLRLIYEAKRLLGFPASLPRQKVHQWIDFIKNKRGVLRYFYGKWIREAGEQITSSDLSRSMILAADVLEQSRWDLDVVQIERMIREVLSFLKPELKNNLDVLIDTALHSMNFTCPNLNNGKSLSSSRLGYCLRGMVPLVTSSEGIIDYLIHQDTDKSGLTEEEFEEQFKVFSQNLTRWFSQPELKPLELKRVFRLLDRLDFKFPKGFLDSLRWLRRVKDTESSEDYLHPKMLLELYKVYKDIQLYTIGIQKHYKQQWRAGNCMNKEKFKTWKECQVPLRVNLNDKNKKFQKLNSLAIKVISPAYAQDLNAWTAEQAIQFALIEHVSDFALRVFDENGDGVITTFPNASALESNEVFNLIATTIQMLEFIDNFIAAFQKNKEMPDAINYGQFELSGLASLVAVVGDNVLLRLSSDERAGRKIIKNLLEVQYGEGVLFLDRGSLTSIFYLLMNLDKYREKYLGLLRGNVKLYREKGTSEILVHRAQFFRFLPQLMPEVFPRLYEQCKSMDFHRSCGITFDEILASENPGTEYINASDLDVLTLTAIGFESLIDSCDTNGDGGLTWTAQEGETEDELYCAFLKARQVAFRLMDSRIIDEDQEIRKTLNTLMGNALTRNAVRAALIKGTMSGILIELPSKWRGKKAHQGTLLSLFAELLNEERVKAYEDSKK